MSEKNGLTLYESRMYTVHCNGLGRLLPLWVGALTESALRSRLLAARHFGGLSIAGLGGVGNGESKFPSAATDPDGA